MEKREEQLNSNIPIYVREVLRLLNEAGHEAFIVGGCVRDILMGRQPSDWDVCTSALPSETTVWSGEHCTDRCKAWDGYGLDRRKASRNNYLSH